MIPLIDRLVILHIYRKEHEDNPALALKELIDYEVQIALDPQVSSEAQALIDRGREQALEDAIKAINARPSRTPEECIRSLIKANSPDTSAHLRCGDQP